MQAQSTIEFSYLSADTLHALISGIWKMGSKLPKPGDVLDRLASDPKIKKIIISGSNLQGWDTTFLTFIRIISKECISRNIGFETRDLPKGAERLLHLASTVAEQTETHKERKKHSFLYMVGDSAVDFGISTVEMFSFIGSVSLTFFKFLKGRASFRRIDLLLLIEECGAQSLPIITLISILVGLILAFVGAVQLKLFGAQIYVANLVAIAMAREMGALMTGIIMAGRTGAAYAAQLGTMQVNEEIDALTTLGISPMEFLVLPRMLALVLMVPLLCLYADFLGIIGGAIVGVGMLDITLVQYFTQTQASLDLTNISLGIIKGALFAVIVAMSGCMRGLQSGRSASAVGAAATSAVVTAIVGIIVTDGVIAVICDVLKI
ncbi:MAG: ABC transporter permease [Deltaproteobacteria bacterium]|jgi:phospholipid/cholesterol/gamma-HCH transport system permease protein|nr:ABC transporter permease [Deltaproteobacteria bacterium]